FALAAADGVVRASDVSGVLACDLLSLALASEVRPLATTLKSLPVPSRVLPPALASATVLLACTYRLLKLPVTLLSSALASADSPDGKSVVVVEFAALAVRWGVAGADRR